MDHPEIIEADLTWIGDRFESNVQVVINPGGTIEYVGPLGEKPTQRLHARALLPGFVNAHSHAFQRGIRGRGESFPAGAGSFWSWREAMYDTVKALDRASFLDVTTTAYREMLAAGITTVGEFHYLHHAGSEPDYALDDLVVEAAESAGIRLVLLNAYYHTGGIGKPAEAGQRRFVSPDPERYWAQMDRLSAAFDRPTVSLGAVVHSIRAAGIDQIAEIYGEASRRDLVFHMHVEEQRQEIEACRAAHGVDPMALLLDRLDIGSRFTAVHCTHTSGDHLAAFTRAGGHVCVCPLTEANLGDGLPRLEEADAEAGGLCLGSDSNLRISMIEEMRWLEYGQRLRRELRGALRASDGRVAPDLINAATSGGADALGVHAGRIEPGRFADFAVVDLNAAALAGADPVSLPECLVFGSGDAVVTNVCVGGRWHTPPEVEKH